MGTVLLYLVVAAVVGGVIYLLAALIFGRGEELPPLAPDATPTLLPPGPITGDDVRGIRFALVLRGYKMSEVDWTLQRVAAELDLLRAQRAELDALRARVAELEQRR